MLSILAVKIQGSCAASEIEFNIKVGAFLIYRLTAGDMLTLDIKKLIADAIKEEREAQINYQRAADEAQDPETKTFFEQLVKEEKSHEKRLKDRLMAIKLIQGD